VGAVLSGVTPAPIPADATTTVTPQSKIVFYQPGIRTDVTGAVAPPSPLSSGSLIFTRISESYKFTSGQEAHLEPYVENLVLYQASGGPSTLTARYTVTPSIAFEPVTLQSGVITVELFEPQGSRVSDVIGADGGSVTASTGERVVVPANGLSTPAAVIVRALTPSDLDFVLPSAFTMTGGLTVSASGAQFTAPVTLSIPAPPQLPPGIQILIARIVDVGTTSRLVLLALGQLAGDRIESSTALAQDPNAFEGARAAGRVDSGARRPWAEAATRAGSGWRREGDEPEGTRSRHATPSTSGRSTPSDAARVGATSTTGMRSDRRPGAIPGPNASSNPPR
jgi:hypothetical protein